MRLIFLTLAIVLFLLAGIPPYVEPYAHWRVRLIAFGLAAAYLAQYPWPT